MPRVALFCVLVLPETICLGVVTHPLGRRGLSFDLRKKKKNLISKKEKKLNKTKQNKTWVFNRDFKVEVHLGTRLWCRRFCMIDERAVKLWCGIGSRKKKSGDPLSLNPGELIALGMKFSKRGVFIRCDIFSSKMTKKCEIWCKI